MKWVEEHKNDADFDDPVEVEARPEMSEEEARKEAIRL